MDKDNAGPSSGRSTASGAAGGMATRNGERVEWKGEAPGKTVKEQQREMQKRCREFVPRGEYHHALYSPASLLSVSFYIT